MALGRLNFIVDGLIPMEFMGSVKWVQWVTTTGKQQQRGKKLGRGWT